MSFLSWGDIFTLPLGGDRIMELRQGLRLFFILGDGEVKIGNCGLSSWGTVGREKVILERCIGTLPRNVLSEKGAAGY